MASLPFKVDGMEELGCESALLSCQTFARIETALEGLDEVDGANGDESRSSS